VNASTAGAAASGTRRLVIQTSAGPAWADLSLGDPGRRILIAPTVLVLGHGAGGSVDAPDLQAVRRGCLDSGIHVALVTQPYRVAGRRSPPPAASLDEAWSQVMRSLGRRAALRGARVVVGGRSAGARVACRWAARASSERPTAAGVLALAFPLHSPGRPEMSRAGELDVVATAGIAVLVVQGRSDPFGMPSPAPRRKVVRVDGDHALKRRPEAVVGAVLDWLLMLDAGRA
jgi:predicted alpha/beta-hydrolase family hydrolase